MNLPKHVAIIMDGNGRWAKKFHKPRIFGHRMGAKVIKKTIKDFLELEIPYLTLYAFSKENWLRPEQEVKALMDLLLQTIKNELNFLISNSIRLILIGDIENLSLNLKNNLLDAVEATKHNTQLYLTIALSYSGRWEIVNTMKLILEDYGRGKLNNSQLSEELFKSYMQTKNIPDPDILIRTGCENRISNFLLWQVAYTELFFLKQMWPEFNKKILLDTINKYKSIERRYGKTSEQINTM